MTCLRSARMNSVLGGTPTIRWNLALDSHPTFFTDTSVPPKPVGLDENGFYRDVVKPAAQAVIQRAAAKKSRRRLNWSKSTMQPGTEDEEEAKQ